MVTLRTGEKNVCKAPWCIKSTGSPLTQLQIKYTIFENQALMTPLQEEVVVYLRNLHQLRPPLFL